MTTPLTPEELREETRLHVLDTFPGAHALCRKCHKPWPCPTARLFATIDAQAARIAELEANDMERTRDMRALLTRLAELEATDD